MTTYTDVFGGANIYPSEISYSSLTLTADVVLSWPEETSTNQNLATRIIDVSAVSAGYSIYMPAANKTGTGNTVLFNNVGSASVTVKDSTGVQLVTLASGELWQVYVTDNTTAAGEWDTLQYGAATSQTNASSLAGTGIVAVGTSLSQSVPVVTFNSNYTAGEADRAKMFNWTGAGGTLTLPSAATVGNNWFCYLRNSGSGAINADPAGSILINGTAYVSFQPGDSAFIISDGVGYYTVGFGQSATFAFDYTVINVPGTGNYTLTGSELNRISYRFTGALTGNRTIIVPATVQQYWVDNQTTGAYTLNVRTSSGIGPNVTQGGRAILYCDGTNVLNANTGGVAIPIAVSEGGTNATTASAALINLGGGSTGIAVFNSGSQPTARNALGAGSVGDGVFTASTGTAAYAALGIAPAGVVVGGTF